MTTKDLQDLATRLKQLGFEAATESKYGPKGIQLGLSVSEEFYPQWELTKNEPLLGRIGESSTPQEVHALFAGIRNQRSPEWTIGKPDE
jgi:hypothetical protein